MTAGYASRRSHACLLCFLRSFVASFVKSVGSVSSVPRTYERVACTASVDALLGVPRGPWDQCCDDPEQHDAGDEQPAEVLAPRRSRRAEGAEMVVPDPNAFPDGRPHGAKLNAKRAEPE